MTAERELIFWSFGSLAIWFVLKSNLSPSWKKKEVIWIPKTNLGSVCSLQAKSSSFSCMEMFLLDLHVATGVKDQKIFGMKVLIYNNFIDENFFYCMRHFFSNIENITLPNWLVVICFPRKKWHEIFFSSSRKESVSFRNTTGPSKCKTTRTRLFLWWVRGTEPVPRDN